MPAHILTPSVTSRGVVNMATLAVVEASHPKASLRAGASRQLPRFGSLFYP